MRIRAPAARPGDPIGVREAAKKYAIDDSVISRWGKSGEVKVLQRPAQKGQQLLLDEQSLQARIRAYTPHRDSSTRRVRTAPATVPTAPPPSAPHRPQESQAQTGATDLVLTSPSPSPLRYRPAVRSAAPRLQTQQVFDQFLQSKVDVRRSKDTVATLRSQLKGFVAAFPELPMQRQPILAFVVRQPGSPRYLRNIHEAIRNFYRWVGREYGMPIPDISRPDLPRNNAKPFFLDQEEIAHVLQACQTPVERALVIAFAQTTARRGELCSIRRSTMHDTWAEVTGKQGQREIPLPDESYKALLFAMGSNDYLTLGRAPLTDAGCTKTMHQLLKRAGIHKKHMGAHAFRHSYSAEYKLNGGDTIYLDIIMGHVNSSNMTQHYLHAEAQALKEALRCAPRRFLQLAMGLSPRQEVAA